MEITVSQEQGRVPVMVFHLKGYLMSDDQLRIMAHEAFDAGARNILLDLTKVQFMSSLGLRALHHIYVLLRGDEPGESDEAVHTGLANGTYRSPHFKLLNPSENVMEVLNMTGYDMFLEIHHDLKKAVASF